MSSDNDSSAVVGGIGIVAGIILLIAIILGFYNRSNYEERYPKTKSTYRPSQEEVDKTYQDNKEFIDWAVGD